MAYAFNKVEDYFRRGKTGQVGGSLQKGTEGAPPPTAAAQNLAKTAETSAEQGNAGTNAYRAAQGSNTAAIQGSLQQPAQRQAQAWGETEQKKANEFLAGGREQIQKEYKAPENLAGAVEAAATGGAPEQLTQALTKTDMTFNPYQVQMPAMEGQQQLAGGVGGIQAALQKQKGGRYSAGMGALDASLLAGNRQAMQGLQQGLGDIYSKAREQKTSLEQSDEALKGEAGKANAALKGQVQQAIQAKIPEYLAAQQAATQAEAQAQAQRESQGMGAQAQEALRAALLGQGLSEADVSRMGTQDFMNEYSRYNPQMGLVQEFMPQDLSSYITQSGPMASYTGSVDPRYQNLANILSMGGVNTQAAPSAVQYQQYGVNRAGIDQLAGNLANQYRGVGQMVSKEQQAAIDAQAAAGGGVDNYENPANAGWAKLDPTAQGTIGNKVATAGGVLNPVNWGWGGGGGGSSFF